ncbi:hypothetical protein CASFOL_018915 [Castilleja foliolosa]|uniref:C2H2-type domain-containing protein n=1 Tax=Castilleja foliolosa TaxID=1961234 RepID=A0ABD3D4Y7_9LAMI
MLGFESDIPFPVTCRILRPMFDAKAGGGDDPLPDGGGDDPLPDGKGFKCSECHMDYESSWQRTRHIKFDHKDLYKKKIKCKRCHLFFRTKRALLKHICPLATQQKRNTVKIKAKQAQKANQGSAKAETTKKTNPKGSEGSDWPKPAKGKNAQKANQNGSAKAEATEEAVPKGSEAQSDQAQQTKIHKWKQPRMVMRPTILKWGKTKAAKGGKRPKAANGGNRPKPAKGVLVFIVVPAVVRFPPAFSFRLVAPVVRFQHSTGLVSPMLEFESAIPFPATFRILRPMFDAKAGGGDDPLPDGGGDDQRTRHIKFDHKDLYEKKIKCKRCHVFFRTKRALLKHICPLATQSEKKYRDKIKAKQAQKANQGSAKAETTKKTNPKGSEGSDWPKPAKGKKAQKVNQNGSAKSEATEEVVPKGSDAQYDQAQQTKISKWKQPRMVMRPTILKWGKRTKAAKGGKRPKAAKGGNRPKPAKGGKWPKTR